MYMYMYIYTYYVCLIIHIKLFYIIYCTKKLLCTVSYIIYIYITPHIQSSDRRTTSALFLWPQILDYNDDGELVEFYAY